MSKVTKKYTFARMIVENQQPNTHLIVISNSVYDVHKFLGEHPGGKEVLQKVKGKDATGPFLSVGHSQDAEETMRKYKVGEIVDKEKSHKYEH
jgi:cytochrome b involved in lipid metabolism